MHVTLTRFQKNGPKTCVRESGFNIGICHILKIQIIVIIVRKIKGSDEIIQNSLYEMPLHYRYILKKKINKEQLLHFLLKNLNSSYKVIHTKI